jgi:hypothetical protein
MTAVLLGDGHAQPAAADDGVVELLGEFVLLVLLHPVLIVELPRQLCDGFADQLLILGQLEVHPARHCTLLHIEKHLHTVGFAGTETSAPADPPSSSYSSEVAYGGPTRLPRRTFSRHVSRSWPVSWTHTRTCCSTPGVYVGSPGAGTAVGSGT